MRKLIAISSFVACATLTTGIWPATAAVGDPGDNVQWKRVGRMDPGTKITVAVDGSAPAERYFVHLSDSELVVLNLTSAELPKRQLIEMAKDNPEWMAGTAKTTYKDNNVRVGPDGVFVKDKKLCNLDDLVVHIPRAKVTAIKS